MLFILVCFFLQWNINFRNVQATAKTKRKTKFLRTLHKIAIYRKKEMAVFMQLREEMFFIVKIFHWIDKYNWMETNFCFLEKKTFLYQILEFAFGKENFTNFRKVNKICIVSTKQRIMCVFVWFCICLFIALVSFFRYRIWFVVLVERLLF